MAIVKMSKFNLVAFDSQRNDILKELQKFKEVNFIDINLEEEKINAKKILNNQELTEIEEKLQKIDYSINLLNKYSISESNLKSLIKGFESYSFEELAQKVSEYDWKIIYKELRELGIKLDEIRFKISKKRAEFNDLLPWEKLDINPRKLKELKMVEFYLGTVPSKLKQDFISKISELELTYYEELKVTKGDIYYLVISHKSDEEKEKLNNALKEVSFSVIDLNIEKEPNEIISEIQGEIAYYKNKEHEVKKEIKKYIDEKKNLEAVYEYLQHKKLRIVESEKMAKTKETFIIKGWIPTEKVEEFKKRIEKVSNSQYYATFEEAEIDDETVPIKLKNGKMATSFESLTGMYAYPKYNEIDPTPFITPFYILFFGIMGADVGYGVLLLLSTFLVLKVFNLNKKTELFIRFFHYLSYSVILWGVLYGSYFGTEIPGLWRLINPAEEYNTLLIGSIVFGIIHIFFGLGLKAYLLIKAKKPSDAVYDVLFWYMALTGGILYLVDNILPPAIVTVSAIVSVIGMVGIVFTGGREAKGIGAKLGGGLYSLYGISSYVGDFVSYSRLMALGLSGGFIASAINMIAGMIGLKGIGLLFTPIILIFGHLFNVFLSFLGAYVHTSRLMYVEFFGKFYEGGGKPFKDFREKNKYLDIED